jgi:hypothetical protein
MHKYIKNIFKYSFSFKPGSQNGQIAIIISLAMAALIGVMAFVIDSGSLYEGRRSFQTVADSAALAAAQELPENPSAAITTAVEYAQMHEVALDSADVVISSTFVSNDTVTVTAHNDNKKLFFGWVFNRNETAVGAKATAISGTPKAYNNMVPFGIPEQDWIPGNTYTLKAGNPGSPGNFQALALGGTGSDVYEDNITFGANVTLGIGDWVDTEPGNMSTPTYRGTDARVKEQDDYTLNTLLEIARETDSGYELKRNDSQLVLCPIIPEFPSGRDEVQILQFAPFLITAYHGDTVTGVFLNRALIIYDGEIAGADNSGIRVVRLLN